MKLVSFFTVISILSSLLGCFSSPEAAEASNTDATVTAEEYGRDIYGSEFFEVLYADSFREEVKPYGYIDCDYVVKKYRANDVKSVYLVEANISFTPGKVAYSLGGTGYGSWYNSSGYIKIQAMRASKDVGYSQTRYGGTPVFKDAYLNTSYAYSNSYQIRKSGLSAKNEATEADEYTWIYNYYHPRNETNHLPCVYIFEMNNSGHDLLEGDLALRFEYQMTVNNIGWWVFNKTSTFNGHIYRNYY